MKKFNTFFTIIYWCLLTLLLSACFGVKQSLQFKPDLSNYQAENPVVTKHSDSLFSYENNVLLKNKYGQWEAYIQGDALNRGVIAGALMDSLMKKQERIFFEKINDFIPSEKKQNRTLKFLRWYNRKIHQYIPEEYLVEIYGLSQYANPEYDYIAQPFIRSLYLHGAHDIGHALVDLALVGCTSSALWGEETNEGDLLIGRNLDFYFGADFAKEKILYFIKPTEGIPFVSVAWPGFLGVVSGMNLSGLTVTMNAGKSKIPLTAKEPISIVARNILQHASNLEEAIAIAKESKVFVSEALMVGSATENKAILIELSPKNFGVFEVENNRLVCANHFQSEAYKKDKRNISTIENSHTQYRYDRMNELLDEQTKVDPLRMVEILRNKEGLEEIALGYGNEKAINQLIAHHGVVFQPEKHLIWVSSNPYQLGAFTAYNIAEVFEAKNIDSSMMIDSLTIPADDFLTSKAYLNYETFKKLDKEIAFMIQNKDTKVQNEILEYYQALNPDYWMVYYKSGLILYNKKEYNEAKLHFEKALQKEITTLPDQKQVRKFLRKTNRKIK